MTGTARGTETNTRFPGTIPSKTQNPRNTRLGTERGTTGNRPPSPSVSGSPPRGNRNGPTWEP